MMRSWGRRGRWDVCCRKDAGGTRITVPPTRKPEPTPLLAALDPGRDGSLYGVSAAAAGSSIHSPFCRLAPVKVSKNAQWLTISV